jgi:uncharacterized protein YecE (DUF72 family)
MSRSFYAGTSGLVINLTKRDFPPEHQEKSRLAYYALHENSIEVNSSFYRLPQPKTVIRWAAEVPDSFQFTFKLWKELTHQKNLLFRSENIAPFFQSIAGAKDKRGCLLVQFPPSLQACAFPQFRSLLPLLQAYDWPIAVEFRHPSWYKDPVYELLNQTGVAMVIQDMPKSATPLEVTSDELVYLRFHGPSGNYKGSYSDNLLYEYAQYIREWQQDGKKIYVYFNNTAGAALANLQTLKGYLSHAFE